MNRRVLRLLGAALLLVGGVGSVYLLARAANARIEGIFSSTGSDAPTSPFERFRCPLILRSGESATVAVTLANPTDDPLDYAVRIETSGLDIHSPDQELSVSLPAGKRTELTWTVGAVERGNQAVVVQAFSSRDETLAGPFHGWPTSFGQGCGVLVIGGPLAGSLVLWLCLASLLLGGGLSFPGLYARVRAQNIDES